MRFRAKSLTSLLFAFLLALPMISVISKVIYVQSNKNAYQSYYGETINEQTETQTNLTNLKVGKTYKWLIDAPLEDLTNFRVTFHSQNNKFIYQGNEEIADAMTFYIQGNTTPYMMLYRNNTWVNYVNLLTTSFRCEFILDNYAIEIDGNNSIKNMFYEIEYNKYSYLDNVFEYAVDEVIKENNLGKIDFFSYFTSIFMSDNQVNNRYIGYVNYYLNYALMVSLAYLLFLMLMWFINFARRFLDRGMNYDW